MRHLILFVSAICFTFTAQAQSVRRLFQDVKLPTQGVVEQQAFTNLLAASTTRILSGNAGATSAAAVTVTTFANQPDSPRNLVVTPGGTTTDIEACVITISGTNIFDKAISETFTFTANQNTAVTGAKAFKTVSSVAFPADC